MNININISKLEMGKPRKHRKIYLYFHKIFLCDGFNFPLTHHFAVWLKLLTAFFQITQMRCGGNRF